MSDPEVEFSEEQEYAMRTFRAEKRSVLLMGVAGAGKSLLIRKYIDELRGQFANIVVVAPTGIAAINIGGSTIHSLFQFAPGPLDPTDPEFLKTGKWSKIQTLIIDEISMVRSDTLTCIDRRLRAGKPPEKARLPFGGVRIIMVGDVCQLEPILKDKAVREFIMDRFSSPWFFASDDFRELNPTPIFLTKSFRQEESSLSSMLDRVRVGDRSAAMDLNVALKLDRSADGSDGPVVCCKNNQVDEINSAQLGRIQSESKRFEGIITGKFKPNDCRTDVMLDLKVGARVLAVANSYNGYEQDTGPICKFINGDIGTVVSLNPLAVDFDRHGEELIGVAEWEAFQYKYEYDKETERKEMKKTVVGTFTQVPLRLGWAISVHKSQGMGFERMTVDFGSGTFASGQAYVGLSRAMSLEGLTLKRPIKPSDIFTDPDAIEFHELVVARSLQSMEFDKAERKQ